MDRSGPSTMIPSVENTPVQPYVWVVNAVRTQQIIKIIIKKDAETWTETTAHESHPR